MHKIPEAIYRYRKKIHDIKPGEKVFVLFHQSHKGEPHLNSFTLSIFPCPEDVETRDNLLAELFRTKDNISGYLRIALVEMID